MFEYHLKVVPTLFAPARGPAVRSSQYSFTEVYRASGEVERLPAVYVHYELSPIMAQLSEEHKPLGAFLTGLCAIIGGVFTLSGVVDALIFRIASSKVVRGAQR